MSLRDLKADNELKSDIVRFQEEVTQLRNLVQGKHAINVINAQWNNMLYWQEVARVTLSKMVANEI